MDRGAYSPWGYKESDVRNSRVSHSKLKAGFFGERHSPIDFSVGSVVKNLPASAGARGDGSSITESGRSPRGGNGNPLQYSWTEQPGQRSLVQGSPRIGHNRRHIHTHTLSIGRMGSISEGDSDPKIWDG